MARRTLTVALAACLLTTFIFCGNDSNPSSKTGAAQLAGDWIDTLSPATTGLADSVIVNMTIGYPNLTYSIEALSTTSGDTIYRTMGTWSSNTIGDTLFLTPANCAIFDTVAKQLQTLCSCGVPVAISVNLANKSWISGTVASSLSAIYSVHDTTVPTFVGEWRDTVPPIPGMLKNFVYVTAILVYPGSTYTLTALYGPGDTAFAGDTALRDIGIWHSNCAKDTVFLAGTNCAVYDTTLHQLRTLDSCGTPAIPATIANDVWSVKVSDFGPVAAALHVNLNDPMVQGIV
jgi:hypothetical protein